LLCTNTPPTPSIYTLSLHDALPIYLKNIWTAPLPPETELSRQMTTSTTSIDIMGLQAAYANLHTDQERDYFMQRYHDVITFLVSMQIGRAVQQECRDRSRMPSSA